ncbi:unnamed protein product [Hymenolepis diminuta]|uniref:F-box/LRR-repeat protein n=1 Tax=Hymenolepis diminuta TaxID=6216 RepID=A0A0R3SDW3_HYMDI|nr:unnamed protein product [Hymenolepis diminuta]VUZ44526.1 unnamed protein product [Hymenolepis diminuta]VUZ46098.1 unnamed protein product [Hymenolepis diminuta]VUZ51026.1 unnamed protein product [Hymenolepis diminuta]
MPPPDFSDLRAIYPTDICFRILRMIDASDKIALVDLANECLKLDIKCDSGMNQQKSGESNYVNGISSEKVFQNVSSLTKLLIERWFSNELHFHRSVAIC